MKPTVGRIVHYYIKPLDGWIDTETDDLPRAAIICRIDANSVLLKVLNKYGNFEDIYGNAEYSEEPQPGCWSWPPH